MTLRNYLYLILLILNLGIVIRFRNTSYFYFFFLVCLIDPVTLIITSLHLPITLRYYLIVAAVMYVIAFPLFENRTRIIVVLIVLFSLLLIEKYHIVSVISGVFIFVSITVYIVWNQLAQIKKEKKLEVFAIGICLGIGLNIIRVYTCYEYKNYFYEYMNIIMICDFVVTLFIIVVGPNGYISFRGKNQPLNTEIEPFDLTMREKQIIKLISKGLTSKEIADQLFLSKKTIDYYRSNIRLKLNITKKSDLITFYNTNFEDANNDE